MVKSKTRYIPRRNALRIHEVTDYFRFIERVTPDDFPAERFTNESGPVVEGMKQLWTMIHMRRFIRDVLPEIPRRRLFEHDVRERLASLREIEASDQLTQDKVGAEIGRLTIIHQLSVTADQAELCAAAFVQ